MKNIVYLILAFSLVTFSCKSKKVAKEQAKQEVVQPKESNKKENVILEDDDLEIADKQIGMAVISISKSVCFGVCPAYSAQIFEDGTLLYEGRKNVEYIGKFKGKIDLKLVNNALEEIISIGYFKLESEYDNKNVTDLPTTVTYINKDGKAKKVVCRFECDPRITKSNKVIEALIKNTKLTKIE